MTRLLWPALALLCCGCGAGADRTGSTPARRPVVLTLAAPADQVPFETFARSVQRLSSGTLRIAILTQGRRPGTEHGVIAGVRAGRIDLGATGSRSWDDDAPSLNALNAPLLLDSVALEGDVARSPIVTPMLRSLRPLGLTGIAVVPGAIRRPFGLERPLAEPGDYRGLRIGVVESSVADDTFAALGATPAPLGIGAALDGLDATEAHLTAIQGNRYDAHGGYLTTNVALFARPFVLFANSHRLARLTPEQRTALAQAGGALVDEEVEAVAHTEREDMAILCRRGLVHTLSGDAAALRRAVEPVYRDLARDPATATALTAIEALKARAAHPPDVLPACGPARAPDRAATTPFDGVYRMVSSMRRDAEGDPNPVPENYGTWSFVFARGRFAFTQEQSPACTWAYGTYTVTGDRVEWRFTDSGGIAPNNALNKPGEDYVFRWNRYRDTLTLRPAPGAISPDNFFKHPWRRIAAAPTARYFARHCPPPGDALAG